MVDPKWFFAMFSNNGKIYYWLCALAQAVKIPLLSF